LVILRNTAQGRKATPGLDPGALFVAGMSRFVTNGLVQDTCKKLSQGHWLCGADAFGDFSNDAAAGLSSDFLMNLTDAEVG